MAQVSAIFTALPLVEPSDGLACPRSVLSGWPLNAGGMDSEGAHGDMEGEDGPLFKGKEMEVGTKRRPSLELGNCFLRNASFPPMTHRHSKRNF